LFEVQNLNFTVHFYNHVKQIREEPPLSWYEGLAIFLLPLLKSLNISI